MAFLLPAVPWAVGGVAAVLGINKAVNVYKGSHPLVQSERIAWAKGHKLMRDATKNRELCALVGAHFPVGGTLELCLQGFSEGSLCYEHWFVKCGRWAIEFGNGSGFADHEVVVHCNKKGGHLLRAKFTIDEAMVTRMMQVVGATNYSLLLRNCEHVANYIAEARWTSMQTLQEGVVGQRLLEFVTDREHRAQRNMVPDELKPPEENEQPALYEGLTPHVQYSRREQVLDANDKHAYNVVVLGPTGAGKSNIINLMFNKRVCKVADDIDSVTRNMEFHVGEGVTPLGQVKRINLIDSIGFCDSHLDAHDVYSIIKETIAGNCMQIHKVLIVTSGRLQKDHQSSIKQILGWLGYDPKASSGPSFSVNFIYTKADGQSDDQKQRNVTKMCDLLGASAGSMSYRSQDGTRVTFDNAIAVGFPPNASFSDIETDYNKLMFQAFTVPTAPISVETKMCMIL